MSALSPSLQKSLLKRTHAKYVPCNTKKLRIDMCHSEFSQREANPRLLHPQVGEGQCWKMRAASSKFFTVGVDRSSGTFTTTTARFPIRPHFPSEIHQASGCSHACISKAHPCSWVCFSTGFGAVRCPCSTVHNLPIFEHWLS